MKSSPKILLLLLITSCTVTSCNFDQSDSTHPKLTIDKRWQGVAPDFRTGDVSPDGKYFTDINWETGELEIIDLDTDSIHPVTGSGYDEGGYGWMSSFSNGGDHFAYEWYNYDAGSHELRIYSMKTDESRVLKEASEEAYYWEPMDWTRNDDSLLIAKNSEGSDWEFGFMSIENGGYRTAVSLKWNTPGGKNPYAYPYAVLSPDNKQIGFDYRFKTSTSMDLFTASVETGGIVPLWEGDGDDRFLFWDKSGDQVFFYSDRSGLPSVWRLQIKNGSPVGEPQLVKDNITGLTAIGMTSNGFAFGQSSGDFNTYYCTVDFETGEVLQAPKTLDETVHYRNSVGCWSEDGDSLAYIQFKSMPGGRESLIIQSIADNGKREVVFPWDFHNKTGTVAWPSKDEVIIDGGTPGHRGLHKFDLANGQVQPAFEHGDEGFFQRFKTNSDGSKFYVEMRFQDPGIVSMDPVSNQTTRLINGQVVAGSTCISPDDQFLAYMQSDREKGITEIKILDLSNNRIRTLTAAESGILSNPLAWSADGDRLLVGVSMGPEKKGLWSVSVADPSNVAFIPVPETFNSTVVVSPNGQHIAYQGGTRRAEMFYLKTE